MKKFLSLILALMITVALVPSIGMAECTHPNMVVSSMRWAEYYNTEFDVLVQIEYEKCYECGYSRDINTQNCGFYINHMYDSYDDYCFTYHSNTCFYCGYNRVTGKRAGGVKNPARIFRQENVTGLGSLLLGCTLTVCEEYAMLRSGPSTQFEKCNTVYYGENYVVQDYYGDEYTTWLYITTNGVDFGWISAGLVTIDLNSNNENTLCYQYTSYGTCTIANKNGGAIRRSPNADSDRVGSVLPGETYWIQDISGLGTGKVWYKIIANGVTGWVSSGLTNRKAE